MLLNKEKKAVEESLAGAAITFLLVELLLAEIGRIYRSRSRWKLAGKRAHSKACKSETVVFIRRIRRRSIRRQEKMCVHSIK